jgi:hypothetical protein
MGCAQMRSIETPDGDIIKVKANIKLHAKADDETIVIKNTMWQSNQGSVEFTLADTGEVRWGFSSSSEKWQRSIRFRFGNAPPGYTVSSPIVGRTILPPKETEVYLVSIPYVGMFNFWEAGGAEFVALKRTTHGWQEVPWQHAYLGKWIARQRSNNKIQHIGTNMPHSDL